MRYQSLEELRRPAGDMVRVLVSDRLDDVVIAGKRCVAGRRNGLHDFRAALRRLRTVLRAYEPYLEHVVPKKMARKLRRIQRSTNTARDLEVQYEWLMQRTGEDSPDPHGAPRVTPGNKQKRAGRKLYRQFQKARAKVDRTITRKIPRISRRLTRALAELMGIDAVGTALSTPMPEAMARILTASVTTVQKRLTDVASVKDLPHMHRVRIASKRLRYLLEPLRETHPAARLAIAQLKELQDSMGELRDASLLRAKITARGDASPKLEQRARKRVRNARRRYDALRAKGMFYRVFDEVAEVVAALQGSAMAGRVQE